MSMKEVWAKPEEGFDPEDNQVVLDYNAARAEQEHTMSHLGQRAPQLEERIQEQIANFKKLTGTDPTEEQKRRIRDVTTRNSGWLQGLKIDAAGMKEIPVAYFNRLAEENEDTIQWVARYRAQSEAEFRRRMLEKEDEIKGLHDALKTVKSLEEKLEKLKDEMKHHPAEEAEYQKKIISLRDEIDEFRSLSKTYRDRIDTLERELRHEKERRVVVDDPRSKEVADILAMLYDKQEKDDREIKELTEKNAALELKNAQFLTEADTEIRKMLRTQEQLGELVQALKDEIKDLKGKKDCDEVRRENAKLHAEIEALRKKGSSADTPSGKKGGEDKDKGKGKEKDTDTTKASLEREVESLRAQLGDANKLRYLYDTLWNKGGEVPKDHPMAAFAPVPEALSNKMKIEHLQNRLYVLVADHVNQGKNQRRCERRMQVLEANLQKAGRGEPFEAEVGFADGPDEEDGAASADDRAHDEKVEKIEKMISEYANGQRKWIRGTAFSPEIADKIREMCLSDRRGPLFDGLYTRDEASLWVRQLEGMQDEVQRLRELENERRRMAQDTTAHNRRLVEENSQLQRDVQSAQRRLQEVAAAARNSGSSNVMMTGGAGPAEESAAGPSDPAEGPTSTEELAEKLAAGGVKLGMFKKFTKGSVWDGVTKSGIKLGKTFVKQSIPPIQHHN